MCERSSTSIQRYFASSREQTRLKIFITISDI